MRREDAAATAAGDPRQGPTWRLGRRGRSHDHPPRPQGRRPRRRRDGGGVRRGRATRCRISDDELDAALAALDAAVRAGLEVAIANVRAVAEAGLDDDRVVTLPEGQTVALREVPVRRAMVYAPSGRNPYPSTVVMGAITARAAGVDEVYVATAPHPVILAAARLCGVDGVFAITGAQAVAAFAYGTETVPNGRRDRRPGQPLGPGGQAAGVGRRRDRRLRRPVRPDRDRDAGRGRRGAVARPAGAGRARRGLADRRGQQRPGDPRRPGRGREGARREPGGRAGLRRGAGPRAPAARGHGGRGARAPDPQRRLPVRRAALPAPRSGTTSRVRTTRCRPRAPPASPPASTCATSAAGWPRCASTTPRPLWRRPACRSRTPKASPPTPPRWPYVRTR